MRPPLGGDLWAGRFLVWYNGDMRRKKTLIFYCITLMVFCQYFWGILGGFGGVNVYATEENSGGNQTGNSQAESSETADGQAGVITESQRAAIVGNCAAIKESLSTVQHNDARARAYLGRHYETILTKYVTPLNVWLVENNASDAGLIANQGDFADRRIKFMNDYVLYQQGLEDLVATDCVAEPAKFYEKLVSVREARARVKRDTEKLRGLVSDQVGLVTALRSEMFKAGSAAR